MNYLQEGMLREMEINIMRFYKMICVIYPQMIDAWHHDYFQMQMKFDEIQ